VLNKFYLYAWGWSSSSSALSTATSSWRAGASSSVPSSATSRCSRSWTGGCPFPGPLPHLPVDVLQPANRGFGGSHFLPPFFSRPRLLGFLPSLALPPLSLTQERLSAPV